MLGSHRGCGRDQLFKTKTETKTGGSETKTETKTGGPETETETETIVATKL
jgi:hypothetical protein